MKRWFSIVFLVGMVVFSACNHPVETHHGTSLPTDVSPELSAIDSLMWQRPDSALAVLRDYLDNDGGDAACHVSTMTKHNRHYANLLLAELLYKNDSAQTNRCELRTAVAFFDSLTFADTCGVSIQPRPCRDASHASANTPQTTAFLTARAHYINGVGYYENDSMVQACEEYLKALEIMEEHFKEKELTGNMAKFMAYTNNRLGDLFSEQFMMDPSIVCYKNACRHCLVSPTSPFGVAVSLYRIGKQFNKEGKKDSADFYYSRAIESLPDFDNLHYRDIISSQALLSYQMCHKYNNSIAQLLQIAQLADDSEELLTRYLTIGSIYFQEGVYDTALLYLEPVFQKASDVVMCMQAAGFLRIIYDGQGRTEESDEYVRYLANNNKPTGQNEAKVSQLNTLFRDYLNRKKEKQTIDDNAIERKRIIARTIGFGTPLFLVFFILILFFIRKRHINSMSVKEKETDRLKKANARLQAKNEELAKLKNTEHSAPSKAPFSAYDSLMKEAICFDLLQRFGRVEIITTNKPSIYASLAATTKEKQALINTMEKHCPNFGPLLMTQCPKFTRTDFEMCRFLLIGLSDPQIAVLLQKDYSTIWKRTKEIKKALQTTEPKHRLKHILFEIAPEEQGYLYEKSYM